MSSTPSCLILLYWSSLPSDALHSEGHSAGLPYPLMLCTQRTLSAQTGSKQSLPVPEGKKQKIQIIPDETDDEDCSIIDVEDFNEPMFMQHTKAMLDEIDKMDEDVYEEPLMDVGEVDKDDPLSVVENINEIYAHYRKREVQYKFELIKETLYLNVNLIDWFLQRQPIARKKLQLVGVTAMLLACKYKEIYVPVVEDFIVISNKAYTKDEVLMMEKEMVNTLQFNLSLLQPLMRCGLLLLTRLTDDGLLLLTQLAVVDATFCWC
ncbi:G2/mitotic-specific cyclin-2-like protein [Tanacetum coccineum]